MRKQILATGFVVFSFMLPLKATAASFTGIYTFGDSLSDPGNVFNTTSGNIPTAPYSEGRFSNGPIWVEELADSLGLNPTLVTTPGTNSQEGINFAYGGATTGQDNTISQIPGFPFPPLPGLEQQIQTFIQTLPKEDPNTLPQADAKALYILWAGANDYLPTQSTFTPFQTPTKPIQNISTAVTSLFDVGARNIMVLNLPDLGNNPLVLGLNQQFPGLSFQLNALTEAHNTQLAQTLDVLSESLTGINLISVDVNSLFDEALAGKLGFTKPSTPCLADPECVIDQTGNLQKQFLFWDRIHPTTTAHKLIGELAFKTLEDNQKSIPEPDAEFGLLALAALGTGSLLKRQLAKASTVRGMRDE
ncbi:MAG TPA: GDSL family lipase, partial [Cyanobacteria bacterium UBA9273]|nr:GDSL family lipase [Cyanobacteria bacterium UBA9273]